MLLMVEKRIRGRICHAIRQYAATNNKYMKKITKRKNHYILSILMQIIYMDGQCLKNYLQIILNGRKCI